MNIALLRHRHGVLACWLLSLQLAVRQVSLYRNVVGRNVLVYSELSLLGGSRARLILGLHGVGIPVHGSARPLWLRSVRNSVQIGADCV